MKKIALIVAALALAGCSDSDGARSALLDAGYKNIEITGYAFTGCAERDTYHTGFKAEGPTGRRVSGVVCGGIWKGKTIRLD